MFSYLVSIQTLEMSKAVPQCIMRIYVLHSFAFIVEVEPVVGAISWIQAAKAHPAG